MRPQSAEGVRVPTGLERIVAVLRDHGMHAPECAYRWYEKAQQRTGVCLTPRACDCWLGDPAGQRHLAHSTPLADSAPNTGYPRAGQRPDGEWEWCYEDDGPDGPPRGEHSDGSPSASEEGSE